MSLAAASEALSSSICDRMPACSSESSPSSLESDTAALRCFLERAFRALRFLVRFAGSSEESASLSLAEASSSSDSVSESRSLCFRDLALRLDRALSFLARALRARRLRFCRSVSDSLSDSSVLLSEEASVEEPASSSDSESLELSSDEELSDDDDDESSLARFLPFFALAPCFDLALHFLREQPSAALVCLRSALAGVLVSATMVWASAVAWPSALVASMAAAARGAGARATVGVCATLEACGGVADGVWSGVKAPTSTWPSDSDDAFVVGVAVERGVDADAAAGARAASVMEGRRPRGTEEDRWGWWRERRAGGRRGDEEARGDEGRS